MTNNCDKGKEHGKGKEICIADDEAKAYNSHYFASFFILQCIVIPVMIAVIIVCSLSLTRIGRGRNKLLRNGIVRLSE